MSPPQDWPFFIAKPSKLALLRVRLLDRDIVVGSNSVNSRLCLDELARNSHVRQRTDHLGLVSYFPDQRRLIVTLP